MDETCLYIQRHLNPTQAAGHVLHAGGSSVLVSPSSQGQNNMTSMSAANYGGALTSSSQVKDYLYGVVNPLLAACGILGNVLSIIVLTQRRMQRAMDHSGMERAARLGLIALAVSDILFCVSTLPKAFVGSETLFAGLSLRLYVQIYGPCLERIFMRTSTWLTVIMAVSRFAAICHPLKARHLVGPAFTGAAIVMTFVVWTLLQLPLFWTYEIVPLTCHDEAAAAEAEGQGQHTYYVLDQGYFAQQETLHKAFTYLWSLLGYVIPVAVLTYCNVHLITALRESRRVRRLYHVHVGRKASASGPGATITPTLVAIVCMLIALVSPAELVHFYYYAVEGTSVEEFNVVMVTTNVLVTMNFGLNFVLYCIVNVQFRSALRSVCSCRRLLFGNRDRRDSAPQEAACGQDQTEVSLALQDSPSPRAHHHVRISKKPSMRGTQECSL